MIKHPIKDQSESKHSMQIIRYLKSKYERNINEVINKVNKNFNILI